MLTPREYAFATPDEMGVRGCQTFCRRVGLPLTTAGYGLLLCTDEDGRHVTVAGEPDFARMLRDAGDQVRSELTIPAESFPIARAGWPDEWVVVERPRRGEPGPWQDRDDSLG